jgi:23S rRNA (adenine2030-N6)-methyltransferase
MKYRHAFHAGSFADVHKHVTLLALLEAMQRKEKGFVFLDTHAGRGSYHLGEGASGDRNGPRSLDVLLTGTAAAPELTNYVRMVRKSRSEPGADDLYPGSPMIAARQLREQDRAVLMEIQPGESRALEQSLRGHQRMRVECADGFERLRAHLPPPERRGLILVDPPYEEPERDLERAADAVRQTLARFETAVMAVWYPIKRAADLAGWQADLTGSLERPALLSELWLYPTDSRVSLNGSGLLLVNPPYRVADRMQAWLPELTSVLDAERRGGMRVRWLTPAP